MYLTITFTIFIAISINKKTQNDKHNILVATSSHIKCHQPNFNSVKVITGPVLNLILTNSVTIVTTTSIPERKHK